jgi:hypothetical protein
MDREDRLLTKYRDEIVQEMADGEWSSSLFFSPFGHAPSVEQGACVVRALDAFPYRL